MTYWEGLGCEYFENDIAKGRIWIGMNTTPDTAWPPPSSIWLIKLLGRLEVSSVSGEIVRFPSRTALTLLAFLSLNKPKEFSNEDLQELFWPESDGDRQAQNLRRAISDLRKILEDGLPLGTVIVTRKGHVSLNLERVATDLERFWLVSEEALQMSDQDCMREALGLYFGSLLASIDDDWVYAFRLDCEERYAQVVESFCKLRTAAGAAKEAVRIARSSVVLAPHREDIHITLIRTYKAMGLEAEALRQFEDLEKMLDEEWGEVPSEAAKEALEGKNSSVPDSLSETEGSLVPELAGGAMPVDSKFYVRRPTDGKAEKCLDRGESVVLIQGPRQVGKSSLLARLLAHGRSKGFRVAVNDFQTIGESQLVEEELFYKTLAHSLASQLGLELNLQNEWQTWLGPNMNLDAVLGNLLAQVGGRVCWGIDEADALFGCSYANNFFGLLRSWHNRRALDPEGPWGKLTLILSYATEAHLFITDLNQSPFNVGVKLPLRDFSQNEVSELAGFYGITKTDEVETVFRITNGQPFLARRALTNLSQGITAGELETTSSLEDGPFGDHLHRILESVSFDPQILEEVRNALSGRPLEHPTSRYCLIAAGVLAVSCDSKVEFRVPAYETYLRAALG